ncbi:hypothetical protein PS723_04774 [Pseudomonas fluorescens]|uniref:Uncharacterized protein n=1 Tax=Pseudomonas fluorescens TaxID=294 RepID=A0A5E7EM48_PSEFL|nr:hypothetical protein PS723_04774 [Pseudomonas fluorescens]
MAVSVNASKNSQVIFNWTVKQPESKQTLSTPAHRLMRKPWILLELSRNHWQLRALKTSVNLIKVVEQRWTLFKAFKQMGSS